MIRSQADRSAGRASIPALLCKPTGMDTRRRGFVEEIHHTGVSRGADVDRLPALADGGRAWLKARMDPRGRAMDPRSATLAPRVHAAAPWGSLPYPRGSTAAPWVNVMDPRVHGVSPWVNAPAPWVNTLDPWVTMPAPRVHRCAPRGLS